MPVAMFGELQPYTSSIVRATCSVTDVEWHSRTTIGDDVVKMTQYLVVHKAVVRGRCLGRSALDSKKFQPTPAPSSTPGIYRISSDSQRKSNNH